MKFLWIDPEMNTQSTQDWVMRINSLNSLHRTNSWQEKASIIVLKNIISKLHEEKIIDSTKLKWKNLIPKIESLYKGNQAKIWFLSGWHCIANKKQEEYGYLQTMYGQIASLEKYFTNMLSSIQTKEDNMYQESLGKFYTLITIEYIRGLNISQERLFQNSIEEKLLEEEHKYSRINHYKFGFLTWNIAGKCFDPAMDFESTLTSENQTLNEPWDIYFIGFQETRKLNALSVLKGASKTRNSKKYFSLIWYR